MSLKKEGREFKDFSIHKFLKDLHCFFKRIRFHVSAQLSREMRIIALMLFSYKLCPTTYSFASATFLENQLTSW